MEKLSLASSLAIVASYFATFFIHFFILLQLLRFAKEQIFLWALSRKWEFSIGVIVVVLELRSDVRPESYQAHQQNMFALDFDQDAGNRLWSSCEAILKILNAS